MQLLESSSETKNCTSIECLHFFSYNSFEIVYALAVNWEVLLILFLFFSVSAFTDYIKGLSPSTLDLELRMLQIIDDDDHQEPANRPELISIELLLDYFIHEITYRNNFEFVQALIRLFLKV